MQAAVAALSGPELVPLRLLNTEHRDELLRKARALLGPARTRAAEERGAVMSLATAAEYALMLAAEPPPPPGRPAGNGAVAAGPPGGADATAPGLGGRAPGAGTVTLVARGPHQPQIAGRLYISVRTVGSHLDRIRDKTGCRRRADLTRLALRPAWSEPPALRCWWFHPARRRRPGGVSPPLPGTRPRGRAYR